MNSTIRIIISILAGVMLYYVPIVLYFKKGWFKFFYHDVLKWHRPSDQYYSDGCSNHSVCKYCGENIMQDSQGNWF